jgi:hypothetical protein
MNATMVFLRIGCNELMLEYSKLSSRDGLLEAIKL